MAPVVTVGTPAANTVIDTDQLLSIDVTSVSGFSALVILCTFAGYGVTEVVYSLGGGYTGAYSPVSSTATIVNGNTYTFRRSPAWPDSPVITVVAVDTLGAPSPGTSDAWLLAEPPPVVGVPTPEPEFPSSPGNPLCQAPTHDAAYFLAMLGRFLPENYVTGLQSGNGYELLQAFAAVGQRLSLAIERFECGVFISSATGAAYSVGEVEIFRESFAAGGYFLKAGTVVTTSATGRDFVTTIDIIVGAASLGPLIVPVRAVWPAWEWDCRGQTVTPRGETIPGEIDTIRIAYTATSASDPTPVVDTALRVRQITAIVGGAAPMLDALGSDRGLPRHVGEQDPQYRVRLRSLPDTVSPGAIQRLIQTLFAPYNVTPEFTELWDIRFTTCWDAPVAAIPANANYDPTLFVYDDPRPLPPHRDPQFRGRWLDAPTMNGAFVVVVPILQPITEYGLAYNDPAANIVGLVSTDFPGGSRGVPAYDIPADYAAALSGAYDGTDTGYSSLVLSLWQQLQKIKAGGVAALVALEGS